VHVIENTFIRDAEECNVPTHAICKWGWISNCRSEFRGRLQLQLVWTFAKRTEFRSRESSASHCWHDASQSFHFVSLLCALCLFFSLFEFFEIWFCVFIACLICIIPRNSSLVARRRCWGCYWGHLVTSLSIYFIPRSIYYSSNAAIVMLSSTILFNSISFFYSMIWLFVSDFEFSCLGHGWCWAQPGSRCATTDVIFPSFWFL